MISLEKVQLLGLSKKELAVLEALQGGFETPLKISGETKISRPGIYDILKTLKRRGVVESRIKGGRKYWQMLSRSELELQFFEAKRALLKLSEGMQEVFGVDDANIVIHRGKDAVKKAMAKMLLGHKDERLHGFQGDVAAINWNKIFSVEETNQMNRSIKKNHLIVEAILPNGWFERQTEELGVEWAKDFEGRTTRVNIIDDEYFQHGGQLFMFKSSIFFVALGEEIIIEIKNSEIQKMLLAMFHFIQSNSRIIDVNRILRELIAKGETKSSP